MFYGHLVYFAAIWYILWPIGTFRVLGTFFPRFGTLYQEKSGKPVQNDTLQTFPFFNAIEDQNGRIIPVKCLFERTLQNGFENKTKLKVSSVFAEFKVQRFCADFHIPECQYVEHPFITGTA
jgi:hypothetical protein